MDPNNSVPGTTPSIEELTAEFAKQKRVRSPPLAFEPTPNDSLAPRTSPTRSWRGQLDSTSISSPTMGRLSPLQAGGAEDLQNIIDQQVSALNLLHEAFAAERQSWHMERDRLHYRIAGLEKLLKHADGDSPAKSPVLSPFNTTGLTSPSSRPTANSNRLPSIAEDENTTSLSRRRSGAPQSNAIPALSNEASQEQQRTGGDASVAFETPASELIVEEIPASPSQIAKSLSPPPFHYRMEAGHTPLHAPRPPTPPPLNSMTFDGIEDTPTRNNTHINTYLTRSNDEDEDRKLTGPLNMPELPHEPGDTNFTFEMLSKKLEQVGRDEDSAKPTIFKQPTPGLATPSGDGEDETSPKTNDARNIESPNAAPPTRTAHRDSEISSNALSPTLSVTAPLSKEPVREDKVQADFESGGIRLKKRPSTNFGAPFGSLGGFGSVRRLS